ncbi:hypothetical protein D3C78_923360 [compost metagenome]
MEFQAEAVQVAEYLQGDLPRRARHDPGEHHLAQLGEQGHADARGAIGEQQADRQQQQAGLDVQPVDDLLERDRHIQVDQLGGEDQPERQDDTPGIGPQVGQQGAEYGEVAATARRAGDAHGVGGFVRLRRWLFVGLAHLQRGSSLAIPASSA